ARLEPVSELARNFPQYSFALPGGSAPSPALYLPVPSLPRAASPALPQSPLCPAPRPAFPAPVSSPHSRAIGGSISSSVRQGLSRRRMRNTFPPSRVWPIRLTIEK